LLALRWRHIHADRITVEDRVYEGEFDDVKTDAGEREVPFDKRGLMMRAVIGRWKASKHRLPDDLVFCTRKGGAVLVRRVTRETQYLLQSTAYKYFDASGREVQFSAFPKIPGTPAARKPKVETKGKE
jgi:hypothetical protein